MSANHTCPLEYLTQFDDAGVRKLLQNWNRLIQREKDKIRKEKDRIQSMLNKTEPEEKEQTLGEKIKQEFWENKMLLDEERAIHKSPDALRARLQKLGSKSRQSPAPNRNELIAEFKERYGENVSSPMYVETLYTNVLGRDYDQSGYNYWLGQLNSGAETRYEVLLGFSESSENKGLFAEMTGLV